MLGCWSSVPFPSVTCVLAPADICEWLAHLLTYSSRKVLPSIFIAGVPLLSDCFNLAFRLRYVALGQRLVCLSISCDLGRMDDVVDVACFGLL